ncbi:energy-coupling factor ABC transporter ATP-binding protein [Alkalihalobacterium elongatum]|uniref:energy-coupling factor ABC transporter ATP-binding protein n=1 Tax=Alkalihalobacterium elongatum TaxID=2675466 RepID=UPI001C1F6BE5|nr:ATP-binding cassette domain-containing protein [Alkalihalobacterium elongatum]
MSTIEIKNINYTYSDQTIALSNVTCSLTSKKIALLGQNGSGKSTLLQHLNGLLLPQTGEIELFGQYLTKKTIRSIRSKVGFVFDSPDTQLFAPTVFEDIAFGPRNKGLDEQDVINVVGNALNLLGIEHLRHKAPYNLSLGQKKKVAIAGVLAMKPEIIIFDEPFSGLDPVALEEFLSLLDYLTDTSHTIILSTHDVDIAYGWALECLIMQNGKMIRQGTTSLLEDEQLMKEAKLANPRLYTLFKETPYRPKTNEEARLLISAQFTEKMNDLVILS